MMQESYTKIGEFADGALLAMVKHRLEIEGIPAFTEDRTAGVLKVMLVTGNVALYVPDEFAEAALRIVEGDFPEHDGEDYQEGEEGEELEWEEEIPECPECGSSDVIRRVTVMEAVFFPLTFIGIRLSDDPRTPWRCRHCSYKWKA